MDDLADTKYSQSVGEPRAKEILQTARKAAENFGEVFIANDKGMKNDAMKYCKRVDQLLFPYLTSKEVELASSAYVDALWEKDNIELDCMQNGAINPERIRDADYTAVRENLRKRAATTGSDQRYAIKKTEAWRNHKMGADYWTPYQKAQIYELRAALQDPDYPDKPRYGQAGPGPEPMRYALAAELHDMNTKEHHQQAIDVLVPYFTLVLRRHNND
ncbi:hypothetical protein [Halorubrum sp. Ea1]|uniref:hypothetical protein n=1 Tax=Halorubrum sp. Ea1 TaxID=1480718 RepID=UPI001C3C86BD|nr:hypothetical protein [Halorubrum sp. Ea1]